MPQLEGMQKKAAKTGKTDLRENALRRGHADKILQGGHIGYAVYYSVWMWGYISVLSAQASLYQRQARSAGRGLTLHILINTPAFLCPFWNAI